MAPVSLGPEVLRSLEGVPALVVGRPLSSTSQSMFIAFVLSSCSPSSNKSSSRVPGIIYTDGVLDRWRTGDTGDKR